MRSLGATRIFIVSIAFILTVAVFALSSNAQDKQEPANKDQRLPLEPDVTVDLTGFVHRHDGKRLFERETFGGNGRTCKTCHSSETGTVSPEDAQRRFWHNPYDPLFLHDGSDDGFGGGVSRILKDATILIELPLPPNVRSADNPNARSIIVRRGIPTTLNTPALDPILMLDGREPDLKTQARSAIHGHAQGTEEPTDLELRRIADFERTKDFFTSAALRRFADGGPAPVLPEGRTAEEKRGRKFFEDRFDPTDLKVGACATCHSGPMLNQTNKFLPLPVPPGTRFQSVLVSEFNSLGNPVHNLIFTNPDGTETRVSSPDPGRALINGDPRPFVSLNTFKIPSLWGVSRTAPYFHDNSAKTLKDLMVHYARFFAVVTAPAGGGQPAIVLTEQDQADMIAYLKLLD